MTSNIVEGYSHKDTPTKAKSFWRISMGSANEMVEHLEQVIFWSLANTEKGGGEPTETRFLSLLRNVAVA
jgi:hypothetical protein